MSRLYATPEERAAREKKMAAAVRTILECIGELVSGLRRAGVVVAETVNVQRFWGTSEFEVTGRRLLHIDKALDGNIYSKKT